MRISLGQATAVLAVLPTAAWGQWRATPLDDSSSFYNSKVFAITATGQYGQATYQMWFRGVAWRGNASSWSIYNPGTQFTSAQMYAARGMLQGGVLDGYATIWEGGPATHTNIHPAGYAGSEIHAMDGVQQAGLLYAAGSLAHHAVVWSGSAQSAVDLHPAGSTESMATGVGGGQQCGYFWAPGYRAVLWSGTAQSMVLLHPPGAAESQALGMVAGQEVGWWRNPGVTGHAALWRGTAGSMVDMHPPGAGVSTLYATCGSAQVGYANTAQYGVVAGIWFGTPESFVPIGALLPTGFSQSIATCVAELNGTYYVGGYATEASNGRERAWMWIGTPACYANCDASTATPALNVLDFGCFLNRFAQGDPYANCDGSTAPPALNVLDFNCFLNRFSVGCP